MIDPAAKLSVSRQALAPGISRGGVYCHPRPVSEADLKLMRRIGKPDMEFPFAGSRILQGLLVQEGFKIGRLHVATLMKRMGVEALYRKPNTSRPAPGRKIYPRLLRKLPVIRPSQVWVMDITCIPMARGFICLAAVLDWFTCRVLAVERLWRTLKYDGVYPQAYTGVQEARASIGRYLGFRNGPRPHSSLDGQTPDQTCFSTLAPGAAAA